MSRSRHHRRLPALLLLAPLLLGAACGDDGGDDTATDDTSGTSESTEAVDLRLGYFPNLTHATALVGVENGIFDEALGEAANLETKTFDAGTEAVEALFAGELDATYIGPNPAVNAHAQSEGKAIRIVAGATSGGAFLVVNDDITGPADLAGKKIATPSLGNTQDVALRSWLADEGFETDAEGGGEVSIVPQENAQTLETFVAGEVDGAWVPEPWATRLQQEGDGSVLVDEADLWPDGEYVTTHLIVRTEYLEHNPEVVERLLRGHVEATEFVNANGEEARTVVNQGIESITGKTLAPEVIDVAWENLTFTVDPVASSLERSARDAEEAGLLEPVDLTGIYDLTILNRIEAEAGGAEVPAL